MKPRPKTNPNEGKHWPYWMVHIETIETRLLLHDAHEATCQLMDITAELKRREEAAREGAK